MMPARLCFGACGPMQGLILCTWVRPAAQPHVLACSRAPYLCQAACLRYAPASASEVSQSSLWHSFPAAVSGVWATSARGKIDFIALPLKSCVPARRNGGGSPLKILPLPIFGQSWMRLFWSGHPPCSKSMLGFFVLTLPSACTAGLAPRSRVFLTNVPSMQKLACRCDGQHPHDAWGVSWTPTGWRFATHLEAQYPRLLCQRVVEHVCCHLSPPLLLALAPCTSLHTTAMASVALQSRRFPSPCV